MTIGFASKSLLVYKYDILRKAIQKPLGKVNRVNCQNRYQFFSFGGNAALLPRAVEINIAIYVNKNLQYIVA